MIPVIIAVSFLVLFAVVMVAVSVGYRFFETQRKKQVEGMLNVVSGKPRRRAGVTIVTDQSRARIPLERLFRNTGEMEKLRKFIQQAWLHLEPDAVGGIDSDRRRRWSLSGMVHPSVWVRGAEHPACRAGTRVLSLPLCPRQAEKAACRDRSTVAGSTGFSGAFDACGPRFLDQPRRNAGTGSLQTRLVRSFWRIV